MTEKICLFCSKFFFNPGCSGYSEMTPGIESSFGCGEGVWDDDDVSDEADYRLMQLKAVTCALFELVNMSKL